MIELPRKDINILNDMGNYLNFIRTPISVAVANCPAMIKGLFWGNQSGKTGSQSVEYIDRYLSLHPVAIRNVNYYRCKKDAALSLIEERRCKHNYTIMDTKAKYGVAGSNSYWCPEPGCGGELEFYYSPIRKFRYASETLPSEKTSSGGISAEVRNTQYPETKKWLPPFMVRKDIVFRRPTLTLMDVWGGPDILIDFVSYSMDPQATAGTQIASIWCDEQPPPAFLEEQFPRLLASGGDMVITLTAADRLSFLYDEIYEKSAMYIRTNTIAKKYNIPQVEKTDSKKSIAVFQAATDDNPTLTSDDIEMIFSHIDDPDALAIRRYGVFKQVSGRIYKAFDGAVHFIDSKNEAFIFLEAIMNPEVLKTDEMVEEIVDLCGDYRFRLDLIDPLASKMQVNTGTSTTEDLNRLFLKHKREGRGTGGWWKSWDTKSTRGRDEIRRRLKFSLECGKPFNNKRDGQYLPTIWILDTCPQSAKSMRAWRLQEWANIKDRYTKDMKEDPQKRDSHMNMVWEAMFKSPYFKPRAFDRMIDRNREKSPHRSYFGRR
jgi:hypothetical protein